MVKHSIEPGFGVFWINFFAAHEDFWTQWCHKQRYVFRDVRHSRRLLIVVPLSPVPLEEAESVGGGAWARYLQSCPKAVEFYISWKPRIFVREIVLDTWRAVGCDERRSCSAKVFAQLLLDKAWQVGFWLHLSAQNELVALICHHCCKLMSFFLRVAAFLLMASCCQIPLTSKSGEWADFSASSGSLVNNI